MDCWKFYDLLEKINYPIKTFEFLNKFKIFIKIFKTQFVDILIQFHKIFQFL